jgi:hypothetical protein
MIEIRSHLEKSEVMECSVKCWVASSRVSRVDDTRSFGKSDASDNRLHQ